MRSSRTRKRAFNFYSPCVVRRSHAAQYPTPPRFNAAAATAAAATTAAAAAAAAAAV